MIDLIFDFSWLTDWLVGLLEWFFSLIRNGIVDLCNALIVAFVALADIVVSLLPALDMPSPGPGVDSQFLGVVNWFLPINHIIYSLGFYATAVALYFSVGPLLRWLKLIQ